MGDRARGHLLLTAEQVATLLEEANPSRRARWVHWPDSQALAAELSGLDFDDRFSPHYIAVREVGRFAATLRKAAAAFIDPRLAKKTHRMIIVGAARALGGDVDKAYGFPSALKKIADAVEKAVATSCNQDTQADTLRRIYGRVAKTLERHTGKPASIGPTGPDARFVRDVVEHAGLRWRPRIWRRYGEEWAAVKANGTWCPRWRPAGASDTEPVPFYADPRTGWVSPVWIDPRTGSVSNRRQKKQ